MANRGLSAEERRYNRLMLDALSGLVREHGSFEAIPKKERAAFRREAGDHGIVSTIIARPANAGKAIAVLERGGSISAIALAEQRVVGDATDAKTRQDPERRRLLKDIIKSAKFKQALIGAANVQTKYDVESQFAVLKNARTGELVFDVADESVYAGMGCQAGFNPRTSIPSPISYLLKKFGKEYSPLIDAHFHPHDTHIIPSSEDLAVLHFMGFAIDNKKMPLGMLPIGIIARNEGNGRIKMLIVQEKEAHSSDKMNVEPNEIVYYISSRIRDRDEREGAALEYMKSIGYRGIIITANMNGRAITEADANEFVSTFA